MSRIFLLPPRDDPQHMAESREVRAAIRLVESALGPRLYIVRAAAHRDHPKALSHWPYVLYDAYDLLKATGNLRLNFDVPLCELEPGLHFLDDLTDGRHQQWLYEERPYGRLRSFRFRRSAAEWILNTVPVGPNNRHTYHHARDAYLRCLQQPAGGAL